MAHDSTYTAESEGTADTQDTTGLSFIAFPRQASNRSFKKSVNSSYGDDDLSSIAGSPNPCSRGKEKEKTASSNGAGHAQLEQVDTNTSTSPLLGRIGKTVSGMFDITKLNTQTSIEDGYVPNRETSWRSCMLRPIVGHPCGLSFLYCLHACLWVTLVLRRLLWRIEHVSHAKVYVPCCARQRLRRTS